MDTNDMTEYIFWLRNWRDTSVSFWLKTGQLKCVITKRKLSVTSIDNNPQKELSVDISLIRQCKITPNSQISNQTVEIFTDDRKISLSPVTPLDLRMALMGNHTEANALRSTIESLRANHDPQVEPNPYLRQLSTKDKFISHNVLVQSGMRAELIRLETLNQDWDAHTSPWVYDDLYGDRLLSLKSVGKILGIILLTMIIVVPILWAIFMYLFG